MSDAIVLVGLSGSGKSTIAEALAARLGRPLIDVDDAVARREGAHPSTIIRERGEPAFRALEAESVAEAVAVDGAIIATGGGAVIDPLNRWALWHSGLVVWLDAPNDVLLERLALHYKSRPMLEGNASERLASMRLTRTGYYRAADLAVDAGTPVEGVVEAVLAAAASHVTTRSRRLFDAELRQDHPMFPSTARVVLGERLDEKVLSDVLSRGSTGTPVVVADRGAAAALPELLSALPQARLLRIASGERHKRLRNVERLLVAASGMGAERGDAWIGVGGGTTTDLVGTAAALYLRGAPFMAMPTTWLGMTDAAIGGKVAVDLPGAKNALGAFWPPTAVIGDIASLRPLPPALRLDGMAESFKAGIIGDPALWHLVETRGRASLGKDEAARYAIIDRSVQLKLRVVERDMFERGERRTLNLGHTIGHALEVESGFRLPHGQAVVLGLRAVATIAKGRGAEPDLAKRIDHVADDLGFALRREFDTEAVIRALQTDKKRHRGRQRWILPMAVGSVVEVEDVSDRELRRALRSIAMDEGSRAAA